MIPPNSPPKIPVIVTKGKTTKSQPCTKTLPLYFYYYYNNNNNYYYYYHCAAFNDTNRQCACVHAQRCDEQRTRVSLPHTYGGEDGSCEEE